MRRIAKLDIDRNDTLQLLADVEFVAHAHSVMISLE